MKCLKVLLGGILVFALTAIPHAAKYKPKDLSIHPAGVYAAHQDFQELAIGAFPALTLPQTLELFDTEKLHAKGFLPVLLVIENRNPFAVKLAESDIFLVEKGGKKQVPVHFEQVLFEIEMKKAAGNFSSKKDLDVKKKIKKEMYGDFETKAFGERVVPPSDKAFGVVFFTRPENVSEVYLYFPKILNAQSGEQLIFFEFELFPAQF